MWALLDIKLSTTDLISTDVKLMSTTTGMNRRNMDRIHEQSDINLCTTSINADRHEQTQHELDRI